MAVHAAGADKTHQVDGLARVDGGFHVLDQHGVFQHLAVLDALGDEGELLVDDAARAHVGVADLAVAHLAVGRPTARPEASIVVMGQVEKILSRCGVLAAMTALPSLWSGVQPKTVMMQSKTGFLVMVRISFAF